MRRSAFQICVQTSGFLPSFGWDAISGQIHRSLSSRRDDIEDTADSSIPAHLPTFMVWGANTGVGKTLFSAGILRAAAQTGVGWTTSCPVLLTPG